MSRFHHKLFYLPFAWATACLLALLTGCATEVSSYQTDSWNQQIYTAMRQSFDVLKNAGAVKFDPYGNEIVLDKTAVAQEFGNLRTKVRMISASCGIVLNNYDFDNFAKIADRSMTYNNYVTDLRNCCTRYSLDEDRVFPQIAAQGHAFIKVGVPEHREGFEKYIVRAKWVTYFPVFSSTWVDGSFAIDVELEGPGRQQQAAPAPAPKAEPTAKDRLTELKKMFEEGLLTEEEYKQARAKVLQGILP